MENSDPTAQLLPPLPIAAAASTTAAATTTEAMSNNGSSCIMAASAHAENESSDDDDEMVNEHQQQLLLKRLASLKQEFQQLKRELGPIVLPTSNHESEEEVAMIETAVVGLLDAHIARLHEYNQVKDIGQMLFGQVAERRGSTTREVYELFDMELTD